MLEGQINIPYDFMEENEDINICIPKNSMSTTFNFYLFKKGRIEVNHANISLKDISGNTS